MLKAERVDDQRSATKDGSILSGEQASMLRRVSSKIGKARTFRVTDCHLKTIGVTVLISCVYLKRHERGTVILPRHASVNNLNRRFLLEAFRPYIYT